MRLAFEILSGVVAYVFAMAFIGAAFTVEGGTNDWAYIFTKQGFLVWAGMSIVYLIGRLHGYAYRDSKTATEKRQRL